jgi:hypothetical protein
MQLARMQAPEAIRSLLTPLSHQHVAGHDDTLLNASMVSGGVEHFGNDERLACVMARLQAGERVTVAAIGGSVSAGSSYKVRRGTTSSFLYHVKVVKALRAAYPTRNGSDGSHRHHNGALPATGPKFYEHCILGQLPKEGADLLLLEFAVNTDRAPAAFERTLRRILALRPRPAVVVVNMHAWTMRRGFGRMAPCWHPPKVAKRARPMAAARSRLVPGHIGRLDPALQVWTDVYNERDEDKLAAISVHYDLPLVSMRAALLGAVREDREEHTRAPYFMIDCKHPNGQGHTYLAQLVLGRLLAATPAASPATCAAAAQPPLPPPLMPHGAPLSSSACARGEAMRRYLVSARGFTLTDEGRGADKTGLVASSPGESATFCISNASAARHPPPPAGEPAGRRLGECVDRPPCDGCEAALDDLRDLHAGRGKLEKWQQLREKNCDAARHRGTKELTACLSRHANRADAPPSANFCLQRLSLCINAQVASACQKSCDMCDAAAVPGGSARSRPLGLWLAYLLSYEHMGRARVSCSGACSCDAVIDAHNVLSRTSVTAVQRIFVRQDDDAGGCCYLTLTVLPQTSSGQTKFKLLSLLFAQQQGNKGGSREQGWQPPGIKVFAAPTLGDMMHYSGPADQ